MWKIVLALEGNYVLISRSMFWTNKSSPWLQISHNDFSDSKIIKLWKIFKDMLMVFDWYLYDLNLIKF